MTKLQKSLFILFNSFIIISFFAGILHFFWAIISGSEFVQLPYGFSIHIIMFLLFIGYCLIHSFLALQPQKKEASYYSLWWTDLSCSSGHAPYASQCKGLP